MQRRKSRHGIVAVQVALSWIALTAMLAVVVDGGLMLAARRQAQATADAAALAAAADLYTNYSANGGADTGGTANTSAQYVAGKNVVVGNVATVSSVTATASFFGSNYLGGPNVGTAIPKGYVEVTVTFYMGRTFSNVFGSGAIPITARAVARGIKQPYSTLGMLLLDTNPATDKDAFSMQNGTLNSTANIMVNSPNATEAILQNNGSITAPVLDHIGPATLKGTFNGTLATVSSPVLDPLAGLVQPTASVWPSAYLSPPYFSPAVSNPPPVRSSSQLNINGTPAAPLNPGVYTGGISISSGNVTLNPGIYYMQGGGFKMNNGTLTGSNVLIYNDPQTSNNDINITGGTQTLTPLTSGPFTGITLWETRSGAFSSDPVIITGTSNSTSSIKGTLYFPNAPLTMSNGSVTLPTGSQIIAKDASITNGTINLGYNSGDVASHRVINLVE